MAQRTVALYEGKYIGIETIYTVINGKQINIPDKLTDLRKKSQNNQLFCPCGCGANLILVAGDRNLREQHFRLKDGEYNQECHMVTEGKTSVDSKIVLKCWLDEKLAADDIESRVAINDIADTSRKYEFTFLSKRKGIAISYAHEKANLSDEKFEILEANSQGIRIICIVDFMNAGTNGQFPEAMMKVQKRQGYCLLLSIKNADYYKAEMRAVYYAQDMDGLWEEIELTNGKLDEYSIDSIGRVLYGGQAIEQLLEKSISQNSIRLENMKKQRAIEEQKRAEYLKRLQAEEEEKRQARQRQLEIEAAERRKRKEEYEKRQAELAERRRIEDEKCRVEMQKREEEFKKALEGDELQQVTPIKDADGNRWVKCEFCGKFALEKEFSSYGGKGRVNLGTCYDCSKNNPEVKKRAQGSIVIKKKYDPNKCPECADGILKEKNGQFGKFLGCSNFPRCRYTRKIQKRMPKNLP